MNRRSSNVECPLCRDTLSVSRTPEPAFLEGRILPLLAIQTHYCWVCEITFRRFSWRRPREYPKIRDRRPLQQIDFDRALSDLQARIHSAEEGRQTSH